MRTSTRLALAALSSLALAACRSTPAGDPHDRGLADAGDPEALYEIRSYHFEPTLLADYRAWAEEIGIPYLAQHVEVVGFWTTTDDTAQVDGAPQDALGPANVTWVIRWPSLEERNAVFAAMAATPEFAEVIGQVPGGPDSYLRSEARFARSVPVVVPR